MAVTLTLSLPRDAVEAFAGAPADAGDASGTPTPPPVPARVVVEVHFFEEIASGEEKELVPRSERLELVGESEVERTLSTDATDLALSLLRSDGSEAASRTVKVSSGKAKYAVTAEDVDALLAGEPAPPTDVVRTNLRWAQLVAIGSVAPDFLKSQLSVCAVLDEDLEPGGALASLGLALDQSSAMEIPVDAIAKLQVLSWTSVHVGVDGRFVAAFRVEKETKGWAWWLAGTRQIVGLVIDDVFSANRNPVVIALPALQPLPSDARTDETCKECRTSAPADFSESEVANNPGIYTEDPGAFCKPFSNPERVLSEKTFAVVARVQQPDIGPMGSTRVRSQHLLDFDRSLLAAPASSTGTTGTRARRIPVVANAEALLDALAGSTRPTRVPPPQEDIDEKKQLPSGRTEMNSEHPLQWEDDIAQYQATTVALGHILEFRVRARSNGYSLGNVASTLTLAPRQTKRIQKISFERFERARRQEQTQLVDSVSDEVTRERDYSDSVSAALDEWATGSSKSGSAAASGGFGFAIPPVVGGAGGGMSKAWSSSEQEGGRKTTASEEQRLRDAIRRHGDARRRLDSTVVSEVSQEETVTGTTEVIRNPNYGHSLTIIYYQILRHLKVTTEFGGARECLFVPFSIKPFTLQRAYRWREAIARYIRSTRFANALKHLRDVATNFQFSGLEPGTRAQQKLTYLQGSIYVTLGIARPADKDGKFDDQGWLVLAPYLGMPAPAIWAALAAKVEAARDAAFQKEHAPRIAAKWANRIQVHAGADLQADCTLATQYGFNQSVRIDFTVPTSRAASLTRELLATVNAVAVAGLPPGSVANATRLVLRYGTRNFEREIAARLGTADLISPATGAPDQGAQFNLPLDAWDVVDERLQLQHGVSELIEHLNEHVEFYHKAIWWTMDRDRLFMMLDGFYVPGTDKVSIASVVDREPVAIIGNCLVYPVGAGSYIGYGKVNSPSKLYNLYAEKDPNSAPILMSTPTDGLYAQTIMDECLGLEEHRGSIDWVLGEEEPGLGSIDPALLASRRADLTASVTPSELPSTIINLQNAPDAPAPSGLQGALSAITNPNAFRDMAGLAGTQANAAAALASAANLATNFGNQAAAIKLAEIAKDAQATQTADQKLATVQRAADKNLVPPDVAQKHAEAILDTLHGSSSQNSSRQKDAAMTQVIKDVGGSGKPFSIEHTNTEGSTSVKSGQEPAPPETPPKPADPSGEPPVDPEMEGALMASWPFGHGVGSAAARLSEFDVGAQANPQLAFASPEHYTAGQGLQDLVDSWALMGLVSGGCFVEDTDSSGYPKSIDQWKIYVPDRSRPTKPYDDFPVGSRAHWHWIVPDANRDKSLAFWTEASLRQAFMSGDAVSLSIGDIVMMGGDLVGEFSDFAKAGGNTWRPGPVNAARGISMGEPFAMTCARLLQFPGTGVDKLKDKKLLERNTTDYPGLKAEIAANDRKNIAWSGVRAVVAFLDKARGPSGCSELLVLSRLLRKEVLSPSLIEKVSPWVDAADLSDLEGAVRDAGFGPITSINEQLFNIIVSNGHYADLALNNAVHFSPHNWVKFEELHRKALEDVKAMVPTNSVSIDYGPIPAEAVARTAFGMHFMSDAFAAGHMRTPRRPLGKDGSLLAGLMHDFDNEVGLTVENGLAQKWRAFGDGSLENLSQKQRTLLQGMASVVDPRPEANKDAMISAMGAAMKQLHYEAQKNFGDTVNADEWQPMLTAARGNSCPPSAPMAQI